jgi:hypothetical protein
MRLIAVTVVALLALAAPALAEVRTLAEVHTPDRNGRTAFPVIDAFDGRVVWSDYDAAIGAWRLTEHVGGVTRALPIEPRKTPFDVDLGPDGSGGTVAAYSRCTRGLRRDVPTPQDQRPVRSNGCDLYAFSFTSGVETRLQSSRVDEYWPSVWGDQIAFVRAYPSRRDPDRTATPYLYLRLGTERAHGLREPSPITTIRHSGPGGRRIERRRLSTKIEGLDLRRRRVAYAWSRIDDFEADSFIYVSTTGRDAAAVAPGATSGGGAAVHVRAVGSPSFDGEQGVHWLFTNRGEPEYFGAFAHRGQASPRTKAVAFAHDGGTAYFIDAGPGAESEPTAQPGGTFALKADDAVSYRRMPRSWQPMRPPR